MMLDRDFDRFCEWFDVLAVTHRLQSTEDLRGKMKAEYFDVLQSYPMEAVETSYQNLRRKMKKWPVPADWLENLPPTGSVARLPQMTHAEMRENDEAEALGYEAASVCRCAACVAANCLMPPRYVPRLDREGNPIERRHPVRVGRAILLGRWIHGSELRAWYNARAGWYEADQELQRQIAAHSMHRGSPEERLNRLERFARSAKTTLAESTA